MQTDGKHSLLDGKWQGHSPDHEGSRVLSQAELEDSLPQTPHPPVINVTPRRLAWATVAQ